MMYNKSVIDRLIAFIKQRDGIADKNKLAEEVKVEFALTQDRKVYYCDDFSIRFSKAEKRRMSNTVLALSALQKYDRTPFFVCIVSSKENFLLLSNSTFLKKISHSSQELRMDNIKGSFNGGDIMLDFSEFENKPENFDKLYAYHSGLSFSDNLERLVESTNGIAGRNPKYQISSEAKNAILDSITRAQTFIESDEYIDLKEDLNKRVGKVQGEIAIAAFIDNVNMRGRVIEYLITDDGSTLKDRIIDSLKNGSPLPEFKTEDKLGDYSKQYTDYFTETDIKTKVLFLEGNPKAYNVDKLLEFLAKEKSVYMIYLLGIDENGQIVARLVSAFDSRLIDGTTVQHHWAGRNSRGVTQFVGSALRTILLSENDTKIDSGEASAFLMALMEK